MRNKIFLLIFLLLVACSTSNNKQDSNKTKTSNSIVAEFPKYREVVHEFFTAYSVKALQENTEILFARKPNGWLVGTYNYLTHEELFTDTIWSLSRKKYVATKFPKVADVMNNKTQIEKYNHPSKIRQYKINIYYGYFGWEQDVIARLEKEKTLFDDDLYSLGRAYSSLAANKLNAKNEHQIEPVEPNIKEFKKYSQKSIKIYEKLASQNPEYEVLVGNISTKLANEYMSQFLDLRTYENSENNLPNNLYDKFIVSTAKNYLNSCAPNAVIFVSGDNDTYPLLYVQKKKKIRQDVLIVNVSMLLLDEYRRRYQKKTLNSEGLKLSINEQKYQNLDVVYNTQGEEDIALQNILTQLVRNDTANQMQGSDGQFYDFIQAKNFIIDVDPKLFEENNQLGANSISDVVEQISWKFNRSYIFKNHLIMLDAINNLFGVRPIYFAVTLAATDMLGLENYLQTDGFALRLMPIEKTTDDAFRGRVNTQEMNRILTKEFVYDGFDSKKLKDRKSLERFAMNYRSMFAQLAKTFANEGKNQDAITALGLIDSKIPHDLVPYSYYGLLIGEAYLTAKDNKNGVRMFELVVGESTKKLDKFAHITTAEEKYIVQREIAIINQAFIIAKHFNLSVLSQQYEKTATMYRMKLMGE